MPDAAPFGETFFDASVLAIVAALRLKRPSGGWVESVLTFATQRRTAGAFFAALLTDFFFVAMSTSFVV
jgi:hypothetical protein